MDHAQFSAIVKLSQQTNLNVKVGSGERRVQYERAVRNILSWEITVFVCVCVCVCVCACVRVCVSPPQKVKATFQDSGAFFPPPSPQQPAHKCGCKKHPLDLYGDHTSTCTAHSGATKANDVRPDTSSALNLE